MTPGRTTHADPAAAGHAGAPAPGPAPGAPAVPAPGSAVFGAPSRCGHGTIGDMTAYQERLAVPVRRWPAAGAARGAVALAVMSLGTGPAPAAASVSAVLPAVCLLAYGVARLRVQDGTLITAGPAVRAERLGRAEIADADGARERRTFRAGPHARSALRACIPTVVRATIADPGRPYRCPYVSTRHPLRVVRAVNAAKAEQTPV